MTFMARWPVARVLSPLSPREDKAIPHLYGLYDDPRGAELCLYYPDGAEWSEGMLLAETIVPWTAEWLFYYEMWQVTGTWGGPEAPHAEMPRREEQVDVAAKRVPSTPTRTVHAPLLRSLNYLMARPSERALPETLAA
ncbi:hypothetical protein [Novosphingobium sp. JCM 18896]|uniref:hypothetical protein n=1 Tax=Novosphingobium sp. JCM 18896 TaxID=2989731 RepID=UPI0022215689|nr:hypothetical protein [Novosphingobium sp. JCM 18896]MCW1431349.1 hypothetical protein [Novosphingobium sp. JCM 18896]